MPATSLGRLAQAPFDPVEHGVHPGFEGGQPPLWPAGGQRLGEVRELGGIEHRIVMRGRFLRVRHTEGMAEGVIVDEVDDGPGRPRLESQGGDSGQQLLCVVQSVVAQVRSAPEISSTQGWLTSAVCERRAIRRRASRQSPGNASRTMISATISSAIKARRSSLEAMYV